MAGWSYGKYRGDYSKYKAEKPLFSIDASNVDKYQDKLSPGQVQFIKQTKGYKMDVYPTHRNAGFPDFDRGEHQKECDKRQTRRGWLVAERRPFSPAFRFPSRKTGRKPCGISMTRYRGMGVEWPDTHTVASPRPGSTEWIETHGPQTVFFPGGKRGQPLPPR